MLLHYDAMIKQLFSNESEISYKEWMVFNVVMIASPSTSRRITRSSLRYQE
jgi:hypothetical protein